jgi:hypothetical protein
MLDKPENDSSYDVMRIEVSTEQQLAHDPRSWPTPGDLVLRLPNPIANAAILRCIGASWAADALSWTIQVKGLVVPPQHLVTPHSERAERLGPRVSASAALSLGRLGNEESGSNGDELLSWAAAELSSLDWVTASSELYFRATVAIPMNLSYTGLR